MFGSNISGTGSGITILNHFITKRMHIIDFNGPILKLKSVLYIDNYFN